MDGVQFFFRSVRAALRDSSSQLLQSISSVSFKMAKIGCRQCAQYYSCVCCEPQFMESQDVDEIREAIRETIDEDVVHAKGGLGSRHVKMVRTSCAQPQTPISGTLTSSRFPLPSFDRMRCELPVAHCLMWRGKRSRKISSKLLRLSKKRMVMSLT